MISHGLYPSRPSAMIPFWGRNPSNDRRKTILVNPTPWSPPQRSGEGKARKRAGVGYTYSSSNNPPNKGLRLGSTATEQRANSAT